MTKVNVDNISPTISCMIRSQSFAMYIHTTQPENETGSSKHVVHPNKREGFGREIILTAIRQSK